MNYIPTTDIGFAHAVRYRDALLRAWATRTGRVDKRGYVAYAPQDVPEYIDPPANEDRSRAEVIRFKLEPLPYGESYVGYLSEDRKRVTTWTGDTLAAITKIRSRFASKYRNEYRGSFWAKGVDGRTYYGTHNGPGMYCRMRLAKDQS